MISGVHNPYSDADIEILQVSFISLVQALVAGKKRSSLWENRLTCY